MSPIDTKPALVQVMAWRRIGDKPLAEPVRAHTTEAIYTALGGECRINASVNRVSIGSDNGLSPIRRPAII